MDNRPQPVSPPPSNSLQTPPQWTLTPVGGTAGKQELEHQGSLILHTLDTRLESQICPHQEKDALGHGWEDSDGKP